MQVGLPDHGKQVVGVLSFAAFSWSLCAAFVQQLFWPVEIGGSQWSVRLGASLGWSIVIGCSVRTQRFWSSFGLGYVHSYGMTHGCEVPPCPRLRARQADLFVLRNYQ